MTTTNTTLLCTIRASLTIILHGRDTGCTQSAILGPVPTDLPTVKPNDLFLVITLLDLSGEIIVVGQISYSGMLSPGYGMFTPLSDAGASGELRYA